jgi:hypothetical protein
MVSKLRVREATQPERDIQKAVIDADDETKIETLKLPDGFENDPHHLGADWDPLRA